MIQKSVNVFKQNHSPMVFVEWPATEANSYVFRNMHLKWWICIMCVLPQVIPWLKHGKSWGLHGSVAEQSSSHGRGQHISFLIVSLIALFRALLWDERGSFAFMFLLWKVEVVDILIGPFMPYKSDALPLSRFPFMLLGERTIVYSLELFCSDQLFL